MKTNIFYLVIVSLLCSVSLLGQEALQNDLILNQPLGQASYDYSASRSISFQNGFQYTATANNSLKAYINALNLSPDPYPGNILGGSGNGIVGTIEGEFDVSPLGQATYNIPIKVPGGTGGIAPQLSITYNSVSGNGLLGSKFDLAGLSMVNRAPSNLHTDGWPGVVNFSASDHFMLDGQRLVLLTTIDSETREYRTENNSFTKVIAKGSDSSNPSTFMAYTKDGLIYEYGSNTSQLKSQNENSSKILFWLIRKVSDTKGNYYTVSYDRDDENGEYWPVQIDYTGNDNAGLTPYNSIRFYYQTEHTHLDIFYIYGMKVRRSKRLTDIHIYSGEKRVKNYHLDYNQTPDWKYQLSQITESSADGTKMNPIKFDWYNSSSYNGLSGGVIYNSSMNKNNVRTGDFNGDGRMDFIMYDESWYSIFLSGENGFYYAAGGAPSAGRIFEIIVGDYNADGYSDIVIKRENYGYYLDLYLSNIGADLSYNCYYQKTVLSGGAYNRDCNVKIGDFNGDGATDLFIWYIKDSKADVIYSESTNNKVIPLNKKTIAIGSFFWDRVEIVDFNGDGRSEIMNLHSDGHTIMDSTPEGVFYEIVKSPGIPKKDHHLRFGDFNGDGKTDMFLTGYYNHSEKKDFHWASWQVHLSKGDKSFEIISFPSQCDTEKNTLFIADFNGDGKDDFIALQNKAEVGNCKVYSYVNRGTGSTFAKYEFGCMFDLNDGNFSFGDFNGDGKVDILQTWRDYHKKSGSYTLYRMPDGATNMLSTITDGLGNTINIRYKPMSDTSIHGRGRINTYPVTSFSSSLYLVHKVIQSNGIGGESTISYDYKNALLHRRGRGLLGFEYFTVKNEVNNIETITRLDVNQEQYTIGIKSVETKIYGKTLNKVEYTNQLRYYNTNSVYNKIFTYNTISSIEKKYEINNSTLYSTIESSMQYDDYGNVTESVIKYNGANTVTNVNTYTNDENKWYLGRLTKSVVTKKNSKGSSTRTSEFAYDPVSGILNKEIVEPSDNVLGYVKTYKHDSYGNILESTVIPNDTKYASRINKSVYDPTGRFETESIIVNKTNNGTIEFVTRRDIDMDLGVVNYEIDPNGLKTEYTYDSFGRLVFTKTPLGNIQTVVRWSNGHSDAPANAVYFTYSEKSGTPPVIEFFDGLGRSLRKVVNGFASDQKIYTDVVYNAKGQMEKSSEPYFAGQTVYWNKNEYDAIGRTIKQIYTDGTYSQVVYNGLTTKTISPLKQEDTKVLNVLGQMIESIDNNGVKVLYEYDVEGNCTKVTGPRTVIETRFDKMGNRIKLIDPDLGTVEYVYNAYGELISQNDAHGIKTFEYDNLGRVLKATDKDGITTYLYDTKWKGALSESKLDRNNISQKFEYDQYGRVKSATETIDNKSYTTYTSYDIYSRPDIVTYPSGFKIQNEYNTNGYLAKVKNPQNGKVYWHAKTMNARGQLEQVTLGNNLTTTTKYNAQKGYITDITTPDIQNWSYKFNAIGNLTDRIDNTRNKTEHFDYDPLNRLRRVSHNGVVNQDILYDTAGNITYKTGVGTSFKYKEGTNRLESVSGSNYTPPSWDVILYTANNKIYYVSQGNNSLSLVYGVSKERKKSVTVRDGKTETKYYVGSLYEELYLDGGEVKKNHYIFAGGTAIAINEQSNKNGDKLRYLHRDHLGSVQAYSDENGQLVEELSYDAWGRRRNPVTWQYLELTATNTWHPRGFTGHEHIDMFEMINMNGRMYDPVLGRFLSPDPFVQAPDYTQGLNRYAYCLNNPLSLIDPSGYSWLGKHWKSLVSAAIGITVAAIMPAIGTPLLAVVIAGAAGGAAAGLVGSLLNGANIGQVAKSTLTGGFWGGVGGAFAYASGGGTFLERLFKHSFSQGWLEGVKGGNFVHGFMAGAVSVTGGQLSGRYGAGWSKAGKTAFNAALSGTAAQLGGGKFANGAITGAYAYLFNDLMHDKKEKKARLDRLYKYAKERVIAHLTGEQVFEHGPVAWGSGFNGDAQGGIHGNISLSMVGIITPGRYAGTIMGLFNYAFGVGGLGYSLGSNGTMYFYDGNISNFRPDIFSGEGIAFNLSIDKGLSLNVGITASGDSRGGVLIGITAGVGYGFSKLPVNGYYTVDDNTIMWIIRNPNK